MQGGALPPGFPHSGSAAVPAPNASPNAVGMSQSVSYANRLLLLSSSPLLSIYTMLLVEGKEAASSNPTPTPAPSESRRAQSTEESAMTAAAPSSTAASMTETAKAAAHQPPETTTVLAGVAVVPKEPQVHASQTVQLQIHLPDGQAVR